MTTVDTRSTPRVFRSGAARFFGWVWVVIAVANLADIAWRGRDMESVVAAAVLLLATGIAYVVAIRPRIVADAEAVRLHNLVRDVRVPWHRVEKVEGGDAVYVHAAGRRHRAFVLQTSPRARVKQEMRERRQDKRMPDAVADYVKGRTATDFAAEQLRDLAAERGAPDSAGASPGEPSVAWAWRPIAALAVPTAAFVIALIIALA